MIFRKGFYLLSVLAILVPIVCGCEESRLERKYKRKLENHIWEVSSIIHTPSGSELLNGFISDSMFCAKYEFKNDEYGQLVNVSKCSNTQYAGYVDSWGVLESGNSYTFYTSYLHPHIDTDYWSFSGDFELVDNQNFTCTQGDLIFVFSRE